MDYTVRNCTGINAMQNIAHFNKCVRVVERLYPKKPSLRRLAVKVRCTPLADNQDGSQATLSSAASTSNDPSVAVKQENTQQGNGKVNKNQNKGGKGGKGKGDGKVTQQKGKKQNKSSFVFADITPKEEDVSSWFLDVVAGAELADYGPVQGTMVLRPAGYALWEALQTYLDARFKETGHENCYFPQLIPQSFLEKEKDHVEGFAPEVLLVTKAGEKELGEPLVVRPTSETMVNQCISGWLTSYRDLPLLLNQWCNVHRWERNTRFFLRTTEFLWQEGHTAHETAEEAEEEALQMLRIYEEFAVSQAALPVVAGRKSRIESFAGADTTYTIEAMMPDGRALQAGTSHNLGTNFAKAFGIKVTDRNEGESYVHQTSWGVSTRMLGGIIMQHGDNAGLRLPPNMAPTQVIIVTIMDRNVDVEGLAAMGKQLLDHCRKAGIRARLHDHNKTLVGRKPGYIFTAYECKGIPVRVELGQRDLDSNSCVTGRRDVPGKDGKTFGVPVAEEPFVAHVKQLLQDIQHTYLQQATELRDSRQVDVSTMEELLEVVVAGKWARCGWNENSAMEEEIKEKTGATLRCYPLEQPPGPHKCVYDGSPADEVAIFARSY